MTINDPRAGNGVTVSGQGTPHEITINGGLRTQMLYAELPDGRKLTISPAGHITVRQGDSGLHEYSVELPSVDEVARKCDELGNNPDQAGEVPIIAYHRH